MTIPHFAYPFASWWAFGFFIFLKNLLWIVLPHMSSFFMGEFLGAELSGQHGNCGLSHLSNCQTLHTSCTLSISTNILNTRSYAFINDRHDANECELAYRCGFVCISLMAINVEQLYMCLYFLNEENWHISLPKIFDHVWEGGARYCAEESMGKGSERCSFRKHRNRGNVWGWLVAATDLAAWLAANRLAVKFFLEENGQSPGPGLSSLLLATRLQRHTSHPLCACQIHLAGGSSCWKAQSRQILGPKDHFLITVVLWLLD